MIIQVRLSGSLRRYRPANLPGVPHQSFSLELPENSDVAAVLARLELRADYVSAAAVNGVVVELDHLLGEGDSVMLVPPAAGG